MNEMINSGLELMAIGMGIVFAFLAMLVVMINVMTYVIQRFFPEDTLADVTPLSASTSHTDSGVIAAISVAIHQYRKNSK